MEKTIKGWVIIHEEGDFFYDFTFSRTRTEAIKKWVKLWSKPDNWKAHYRNGYRCVKAEQTTKNL